MRESKALAALIAVITILFIDVLFFGNNFYARDVALQYYPIRRVLHDIVASGHFPFWNPRISAGQPLAANPAYQTFYPFQWTIFLPDFDLGFRLAIILHFYLAAIGTYLLLRSLGTRIPAALFGAITFVLGGTFLSLTNLLPFLFSAAWLPWIGFFWRRSNFPLTALSLGMLLLAGDQTMILQAGALLCAYALYRGNLKRALAAIALAILVGAVQLIPALDLQRDSVRSQPIPYQVASSWSLGPQRPLEILFPNIDSWYSSTLTLIWSRRSHPEFPLPLILNYYPGLLAGVLILAGFIARARGWTFAASWAAFSFLLALGRFGPLFPILYKLGVRSIRYPEKFFVSAVFVLTIFAALVFDDFDRVRRIVLVICGGVAIVSILMWALTRPALFSALWGESNALFITASRRGWILSAVMSAVLLALVFIGNRALFALFILIDLGIRIGGLAPRMEHEYYDPPPIARSLRPGTRIYNDAVWTREHVSLPIAPLRARLWALRNGMLPRMEEIWGFEGIFEGDYDLTNLLPTADLTRTFRSAPPEQRAAMLAMAGVTEVAFLYPRDPAAFSDAREYSYVRFQPFPGNSRYGFAGKIVRVSEQPNAIDLDVESGNETTLIIAITRHKYWKAMIDGTPAAIHPANIAFQAIDVPRGRHHVALRYRNPLVIIFGVVSLVTVLSLLTAHFVAEHRRRGGDIERVDAA